MAPSEDSEDPHLDALQSGARAVGVRLDEAGARRLLAYLDAVLEANRRIMERYHIGHDRSVNLRRS